MSKLIKFLSYLLLALIIFVLVLAIFSQTPVFKNWLKNRVLALAESQINGTIQLKSLQGTLFTYVQLEDLAIDIEGQTFLRVKRAFVRYSPLALLSKKIHLRQVSMVAPELYLSQQDAGNWNFTRLLKSTGQDSAKIAVPTQLDFNWEISAPHIQISAGTLDINTVKASSWQVPQKIRNLSLKLGFWLVHQQMNVSLENLSFEAQEPELIVRTIHSNMKYDAENFQAKDFAIETRTSKFTSSLEVKNLRNPELNISIKGQPIDLSEVRRALPELKLYGNPRLDFAVRGPLNNLDIKCNLWIAEAKVALTGKIQIRDVPYGYHVNGRISNLNLAELTRHENLSSDLNMQFQVQGQGTEWGQIFSQITVDLDTSLVLGKRIAPSRLQCDIKGESLTFTTQAIIDGARANISARFLANKNNLNYRLKAKLQELDLGRLLNTPDLASNVNLEVALEGTGWTYDTMTAKLAMHVLPSSVNQIPVDSAYFNFELQNQILNLRQFAISSPLVTFLAEGDISIHKENHLQLKADFRDFSLLSRALPIDSLSGKGHFSGRFEGALDSLQVETEMALFELGAADLNVGQFQATCSGIYSERGNFFQIEGRAAEAVAFGLKNVNTDFKIELEDSVSQFDLQLQQGDEITVTSQGKLKPQEAGYQVDLEDLAITYLEQQWQKANEATRIQITESGVEVSQLDLSFADQLLTLAGVVDSKSFNNFKLKLANMDISRYRKFLAQEVPLDGRFNFDLHFTGTMANPIFDGTFELVNGQYSQVPFARFAGNFAVQENALLWQCALSQVENDSLLQTSGHLPLKLSLVPYEYKLFPDEQLEWKVNARGLDLSFLQAFTKSVQNIKGTLVADVVLKNTLNDLRGVGPIRLFDGEFDIPELGTKYRNVNLALILKDKDLLIRDFRMRSGGGELKLVEGGLSLTKKSLKDFKARFKVDNFQLMNNKKMQAKVKGEIDLTGSVKAPYFTGDLTVNQSRVYYPAWIEEETVVELTSRPFFIIAPDSTELDTTGALRFQKSFSGAETEFTETQFYKNLRGELSVYFPRNTWIRSEDTNIEVEGDLAAVKEGPRLALFGSFSAIRGYYEVLGNRFQIKRGELVFNGELEPNPEVDIEADYEFKDVSGDDPQKHKFVVLITGTLYEPEFKFTLDGKVAAQEDILSVLVFGQSYADLSFGQKNSVSNDSGLEKKATGFLTGQVLKRLSGRLGQELHLDVIQIESGKNLEDARLRVGKYVTPDVFVSISQDFGAEGNQKVELEYEIPKKILFFNLLLQASKERQGNTGLDVIWKIEW